MTSVALVGAVVLVVTTACSLSDEELARQARNPDVASSSEQPGETSSQPIQAETDASGVKVIAGLGAPIANRINGAGIPGLGDTSTAGIEVSPDQQACIEREASVLEPEDIRIITNHGRFVDLTLSGSGIVRDAISTCIPADMLAERLAEEYLTRLGAEEDTDPKFTECITGGLEDDTGALVFEVARKTADGVGPLPRPVTEAVDPCGSPHLEKLLVNHYANEGYDFDGATCITFGFIGRMTLSDLLDWGGVANFEERLSPILALDMQELVEGCGPKKADKKG